MIIVSVVAFTIAMLLILESAILKSDFFSPGRIYLFSHSLTLGIAFLALDKAMAPFQPLTSLVYFGSGACFLLGVWMAGLQGGSPGKSPPPRLDFSRYNWTVHTYFAFALFFVFTCGMILNALKIGTFPLFAKEKAEAIHDFFTAAWLPSIALSYGGVTMALFFMSMFRPGNRRKVLTLGFWMMMVSIVIFSLALSRSGFMFFAFFALIFYHQAIRRVSVLRLFLMFFMVFTFFLATAYLKMSSYQKEFGFNVKPVKAFQLFMKVPYIYVANNFWNLDYALNPGNFRERHPTTYGYTTLSGAMEMMILPGGGLGAKIREAGHFDDQFQAHASKIEGLNTIGYQWGLYKDFGVAGVFLCPFLFGLLLGVLYLKKNNRPTVLNSAMYAYLAFFVGWSWFLAFWESTIYFYGLFYIFICCYFSQRAFSESGLIGIVKPVPVPLETR